MSDGVLMQWALWYASKGLAVFPCHTLVNGECSCGLVPCKRVAKHPRTINGVLSASTDPNVIQQWWSAMPDSNIGIAAGKSGLSILDIDPRHGGDESLAQLRSEIGREALETPSVITGGGGQHLYFRAATINIGPNAGKIADGLDIRDANSYVIAPPSIHSSNRLYLWEEGYGLDEIDVKPFPQLIEQRIVELRSNPESKIIADVIPHGQQHATLVSFAGTIRRRGGDANTIFAAIWELNKRCEIPGSEHDIRGIADRVAKYPVSAPLAGMVVPEPMVPLSVGPEPVGNALVRFFADPIIDKRRYESNIRRLDDVTGGFRPGEMTLLGAWTGVGKSGFSIQIALNIAQYHKVLFFPLELGTKLTEKRMLAQLMRTSVDWIDHLHGTSQTSQLYPYVEKLQTLAIEMLAPPLDEPFGYEHIKDLIISRKPDFVVIDHLQHIDDWTPNSTKRSDLNAAKIVRDFRGLADREGVHLFLVHQLKAEKIQKAQRPQIYDFADTAALPRVADTVICLHRPFRGQPKLDTVAEVLVLKNRNGPEPWIHTHYVGKSMSLMSMTQEEEENALCCKKP